MERTGGKGLDVCIVACPSPQAQTEAVELMGLFGRVLFFGGLPASRQPVPIDTNLVHYRQLSLHGSTRASLLQYRKVLEFVQSGRLQLGNMIDQCECAGNRADGHPHGPSAGAFLGGRDKGPALAPCGDARGPGGGYRVSGVRGGGVYYRTGALSQRRGMDVGLGSRAAVRPAAFPAGCGYGAREVKASAVPEAA